MNRPAMYRHNLLHDQQSQTMALLGDIFIANHIMRSVVQPLDQLLISSHTVIFNRCDTVTVFNPHAHMDAASLFIMIDAI